MSAMQSMLLPDMLPVRIQAQHMQCDQDSPACRAYESIDTGHTAASPALHCTAENNSCLLCKAFCCPICLLPALRHSTCSVTKKAQHAEHMKGSIDTGHKADTGHSINR